MLLRFIMPIVLCGCSGAQSVVRYELADIHPAAGWRCRYTEEGNCRLSGSGTHAEYERNRNPVAENTETLQGGA